MTNLDPEDTRLLVHHMRTVHRWDQDQFAAQADVDPSSISRWENGAPMTRKSLVKLAAGARLSMRHIEEELLPALRASRLEAHGPRPSSAPAEKEPLEEDLARVVGAAMSAPVLELVSTLVASDPPLPGEARLPSAADRAAVPALAERFLAADAETRALFVERGPEFQTWHFAEWLAHESERAAARNPKEALVLAHLALQAAELATAEDETPWRPRLFASVCSYVANAQRASQNLKAAEAASKKGQALWKRGAKGDPAGLLPAWRVLDLEASLRRDQRRFPEALDLHRRALALAPKTEAGRLLLKKAFTLEQKNDYARALATLEEAAPCIDAGREPRHRFGLCYNQAICMCHLGRAGEAEGLLPEVRSLAVRLDNDPDSARVRWLEGRVSAGLGRVEEAVAAYDEVRGAFEDLKMPFDSALASLDLALLYREQQRWPEIRALSADAVRIFAKGKIHREVHAAMLLFEEAAVKEAVSVALLRRLQAYLEQARAAPALRFGKRGS